MSIILMFAQPILPVPQQLSPCLPRAVLPIIQSDYHRHLCGINHSNSDNGDGCGTRTRVTAVKGRCLNLLTNPPYKSAVPLTPFNIGKTEQKQLLSR